MTGTLPRFLGIGAQRAGTTWLHKQLRKHRDIFLPSERKEIHFFDRYYERGIDWYQGFFPPAREAQKYQAVGEITPKYLYDTAVPSRIHAHIPKCRFLVMLRNPTDRAYSQYGLDVRNQGENRNFSEYVSQKPDVILRGFYSKQLKRYLQYFPLKYFLILIFEQTVEAPEKALKSVADFLCVDFNGFSLERNARKVYSSHRVRFERAFGLARRLGVFLRAKDMDWLVNMVKAAGLPRIFGSRGYIPPLDSETRANLISIYEKEILALEKLLSIDLTFWKEKRGDLNCENLL
jgi:hypothetical protein